MRHVIEIRAVYHKHMNASCAPHDLHAQDELIAS